MNETTTTVRMTGRLTREAAASALADLLRGVGPGDQHAVREAFQALERLTPPRDAVRVRAFLISAIKVAVGAR